MLILIQPSLGVAILMVLGFLGVLIASDFKKRYLLVGLGIFLILIPIFWSILAPYQKLRILTFIDPTKDPYGAGYNSLQSQIAVGSGKILGRGLGKGVQTQLSFLPERQTDFIFASISEELGILGSAIVMFFLFFILFKLASFTSGAINPTARAYLAGLFLMLLSQIIIHIGMNMGLLPITGVPLPLVSAGGSSLMGTVAGLAIALRARNNVR